MLREVTQLLLQLCDRAARIGRRLRPWAPWGQRLLVAAMLSVLAWRLTQLGWGEVARALPTAPLFYLVLLLLYLQLPLFDALAYRQGWSFRYVSGLGAFFRKRVYNQEMFDYAGTAYLFVWARRRLRLSRGEAFHAVKDNSIVSALCAYCWTLSLPALCYLAGQLAPEHRYAPE